ncbi:MAG: hypothetical protein GKR87_06180 [Kiritimatiellae bacterium]|nr:hypothetical protein [Kiritimatiellia bacterium]
MKNKQLGLYVICSMLIAGSSIRTQAASAYMGVDFLSAYVFRGATINKNAVAQPYLEISELPNDVGLVLGVWGNFDIEDHNNGSTIQEDGHFSEVDLYASYVLPLNMDSATMSIGYTEYLYPTQHKCG